MADDIVTYAVNSQRQNNHVACPENSNSFCDNDTHSNDSIDCMAEEITTLQMNGISDHVKQNMPIDSNREADKSKDNMKDKEAEGSRLTDNGRNENDEEEQSRDRDKEEEVKHCWVCFASDEDDTTAAWVQPCKCCGTAKWVHQTCIQRWVDEKQKGRSGVRVSCPQCSTEYIIIYPSVGPLVMILDTIDGVICRVCPFITAGIFVGSVYWAAVTYGAVTVMQVVGHKDGSAMMEQADPFVLLVGLPTIPIMLVMAKMLRWEDQTLRFLRRHAGKVPILRDILPSYPDDERVTVTEDAPPMSTPRSVARVLCGALLLPSIANICGKLFFESVNSSFRRTLLGGVAFITIKGAFKIYYKQQKYVRICQRRIMDYTDDTNTSRPDGESICEMGSSQM